jgi:hypothetical protein
MLQYVTTDSTPPAEPTEAVSTIAEPSATYGGFPADVFVKGGTTTMRHDMMVQEQEADAERRRDLLDKERQIASLPFEQGGGRLYNNYLTPNPEGLPMEKAKVLLQYLTPSGDVEYNKGKPLKCLADVLVGLDPAMPTELTLVLVCPKCETKMPQGQCQIQIRQSNRRWELDQRTAGELIVFEGKPFRSAGTVMESEKFTCGRCTWTAHIDKNRVWPE